MDVLGFLTSSEYFSLSRIPVMGAPYRVVNSKVATALKLKLEDRERRNSSQKIKMVKLNIVKQKALLNKFSQGKLVILVECQRLKLK